ncbi:MAG TPA: hypothetical protein VHT73_15440 [Thermodesulfobacteriota bacterium]|nr:hypothetical protein [Thermodesulfobacteriota bacterium]
MNQCLPALINYDTEVVGRVRIHIEELMKPGIVDSVGSERLLEPVLKSRIKICTVSVITKSRVKSAMMKSGVKSMMREWLESMMTEPMMKAVMSTKLMTVKMTEVACGAYRWDYQNKSQGNS